MVDLVDLRDHLVRGRNRIEKGWCYGTLARNDTGSASDPNSSDACRWCAIGAIYVPMDIYGMSSPLMAAAKSELNRVIRQGIHPDVPDWLHHSDTPMILPPIVMFNDSVLSKKHYVDGQRIMVEIYNLAINNVENKIAHES